MSVIPNERIVKTPGTCGGRARIAGHRVRVQDVVIWSEYQGMTPDEIVSHIPRSLSLMCTAQPDRLSWPPTQVQVIVIGGEISIPFRRLQYIQNR